MLKRMLTARSHDERQTRVALLAIAIYMCLLIWRYDSIPPTLVTDTVDEVETGYRVVRDHHFTVMSFDPHVVGVETLWVSLNGLLVSALGHTAFAALAPGWLGVFLLLISLVVLARLSRGRIDPLVIVLTAISTMWLFHYGRIGYRVISTTFFLSLTMAGVLIFLRDGGRRWRGPLLMGASMSIAMYCYTSARVVPIGFVIFMLGHLLIVMKLKRDEVGRWFRGYARTCVIALVISIPNIEYALREPARFFGRGVEYNLKSGPEQWPWFVIESLLTPVFYDHSKYTEVVPTQWLFDPGAVMLPSAGISAVYPVIGLAAVFGIVVILRRERGAVLGAAIFGLLCYLLTCTLIGFIGPSLTRLLINLPLVALAAAVALTSLGRRFRITRWISASLVVLTIVGMVRYVNAMNDPFVRSLFAPAAREMAAETLLRARSGQDVLVLIRRRTNVFKYYIYEHPSTIYVLDFMHSDFDRKRVEPFINTSDVVIIEEDVYFDEILRELRKSDSFSEARSDGRFSHVFERAKPPPAILR